MCPRELSLLDLVVIFDSYFSFNKYPFFHQTSGESLWGVVKGTHKSSLWQIHFTNDGELLWIAF